MRLTGIRPIGMLALLCVATFGSASVVLAQNDSGTPQVTQPQVQFSISPIGNFPNQYFQVDVEAGESLGLAVGIRNGGSAPIELRTFATNVFNPPNGGFSAQTEDDEKTGPTLWLDYPSFTMELDPGEVREQEFTITVPEGTPPGQYVAALVVRTADELQIDGSDVFRQILRNAMSVEITVPGPVLPEFELGEPVFTVGPAVTTLDIPVTNTGNILVKPSGELLLMSPDGRVLTRSSVEMGSVYGGMSTIIQILLPDQFPSGDYLVSIDLNDEATDASAALDESPVSLAETEVPNFEIQQASVTPNGAPVQYADVAAVITNNGPNIPTTNVTLNVTRDGEEVESYPLAENQALPTGSTDFSQRYIPVDGWQEGTYTFELVISAVSGDTETVLATVEIPDEIVVP